jgi:hypothetical protein
VLIREFERRNVATAQQGQLFCGGEERERHAGSADYNLAQ